MAGIPWVGYAPLFLARELGHYRTSRLHLLESASNTASLMVLAAVAAEAATLTLDECLSARTAGLDLRVILVFDESAGADVVMARPQIRTPQDLRGKRVGVEERATGALLLAQVLETAGLKPEEIDKVTLSPPDQVRAYAEGAVDAVVSFEPHATRLTRAGAHRLVDSRQFPGLIVDVLAVRGDALASGAEAFAALLAGYFAALAYMGHARAEATARLARQMGMSTEEVFIALAGVRMFGLTENHAWLGGPTPRLLRAADRLNALMLRSGLLGRSADTRDLAEGRFLPSQSA